MISLEFKTFKVPMNKKENERPAVGGQSGKKTSFNLHDSKQFFPLKL